MAINSCGAFFKWQNPSGANDFLQLIGSNGLVLGGINSSGSFYGSLSSGVMPSFSVITSGVNTAALVVGSGGSLAPSGTGIITASNGVTPFLGVPSGACTQSQIAVDTSTGNFYSCVSGSWIKVGPGGNPGVLVSPVITPNPLAFDVNLVFKGPNPWTDVTRYGVRSLAPTSTPASVGITATINSGSTSAVVSTSSCPGQTGNVCFVNGDGVVIYGAGTTHSLTTPGAPSITPSLAIAGTGTGFVVNSPTGSTTYCYRVVARTKLGGLTAAGPETCIANGVVALGVNQATISTLTRNNDVVTVVTSTPHGFPIGCSVTTCGEVYITGAVDIGNQNFKIGFNHTIRDNKFRFFGKLF